MITFLQSKQHLAQVINWTKTLTVLVFCMIAIPSHAKSAWEDFMSEALLSSGSYHRIKMEKLPTGHDTVKLKINGVEGNFIVDTGAITSINDQLKSKYKLSADALLRTVDAAGAGGPIKVSYFDLSRAASKTVVFDMNHKQTNQTDTQSGIQVTLNELGVTDLNVITQGLFNSSGVLIDGILGQDVLLASSIVLDVGRQNMYVKKPVERNASETKMSAPKVRLLKHSELLIQAGFKPITLDFMDFDRFNLDFMIVNLNLNGVDGLFLVDSGAGRSMLNNSQAGKYHLKPATGPGVGGQSSSGAGGAFGLQLYQIDAIQLAGMHLKKEQLAAANLTPLITFIEQETGQVIDGVIGQDIMVPHQAIIDVAQGVMYLKE